MINTTDKRCYQIEYEYTVSGITEVYAATQQEAIDIINSRAGGFEPDDDCDATNNRILSIKLLMEDEE